MLELAAAVRDKFGKATKTLREAGLIPAELYGQGVKNVHVAVPAKEFKKVFREAGENMVITLAIGKEKHPVMIHEVKRDILGSDIAHIDFHEIRMDQKIKTGVPIEFVGESPAVKTGGLLNKSLAELEVEALPADVPHRVSIDISKIVSVNDSVYVKDIVVPKNVKVLIDPETVVATVTEQMAEEIPAPVAVDLSEVKVETEEKKAEREKEKEKETTE